MKLLVTLVVLGLLAVGCGGGGSDASADIDGHWTGAEDGFPDTSGYRVQFWVVDHSVTTFSFTITDPFVSCPGGTTNASGLNLAGPVPITGPSLVLHDVNDESLIGAIVFDSNTKATWRGTKTFSRCTVSAGGTAHKDIAADD